MSTSSASGSFGCRTASLDSDFWDTDSSVDGSPVRVDPSSPYPSSPYPSSPGPSSPGPSIPGPSSPGPSLQQPEIDLEFLNIWYQDNYFKVNAHDRAQIQLQELVAKWFNKQGYQAQEARSLETLISILHAYIQFLDAKLKEFDVDVGEAPSGEVPGSAPSGGKGAFFVIEQQKRQLSKATNEIHQLRDHAAHLDEQLTNVINSQGGVSGTFAHGQMDGQNLEAKRAAIARLTEEHEYLKEQLNELNIFVMVAGEYIEDQDVEVERLKEEIEGILDCADQLRQRVEGPGPLLGTPAIVPDYRIARTFNQPPVNRTFQEPPSAAGIPVDQNQMPQGPLAGSPIRQNQLPLPDAGSIAPRIRESLVNSEDGSLQISDEDSSVSLPEMDRAYSGADNSYETSYEGSYESSGSSLDPNEGPDVNPADTYQIPQPPVAVSSPCGWDGITRPKLPPPRVTHPFRWVTKDTTYSPPARHQTYPRVRQLSASYEDDSMQSRHDSLYSPGMDRTYSGAERDNSYQTSYEGTCSDSNFSLPILDPNESYPDDVFLLPGATLEGEAFQEAYRRQNRYTLPRLLKPRRREDSLFGRSIGPLNRSSERDTYSYSDSWLYAPNYSQSSAGSSGSEDLAWNEYLRSKGSMVRKLQGAASPPRPPGTPPRSPNGSLKQTVMLQSPSREAPLLLDIDVQPRPIIETASGEHVVCDITLDMIEPVAGGRPGLRSPRGVSRQNRSAVNPLWGKYSPGRAGTSTEPPRFQTAPPEFNSTFDVPPRMNRTFQVSPRMNRTF